MNDIPLLGLSIDTPCFGDKHRYYYTIKYKEDVVLRQDDIISCIHKLLRQGKSAMFLGVIEGYFRSTAKFCQTSIFPPTQKRSVTGVVNRIAIAMLEEGILMAVRHTPALCDTIIKNLCLLNTAKECGNWDACIDLVFEISRLTHNVPRRRDISYTHVLVRSDHENVDDMSLVLKTAFTTQNLEMVKEGGLVADKQALRLSVVQHAKYLLPLLDVKNFMDCKEFRKVLYMVAMLTPTVDIQIPKVRYEQQILHSKIQASEFTIRDLTEAGVYDRHTGKGRALGGNGNEIWLSTGIKCASGDPSIRLHGLNYAELETIYREVKTREDRLLDRKENVPNKKKRKNTPGSDKKDTRKKKLKVITRCGTKQSKLDRSTSLYIRK